MNKEYTQEEIEFFQQCTHNIFMYSQELIEKNGLFPPDVLTCTAIFTGLISCIAASVKEDYLEDYLFNLCQTVRKNYQMVQEMEKNATL